MIRYSAAFTDYIWGGTKLNKKDVETEIMKVINIMNFVRADDYRYDPTGDKMFNATKAELEVVKKQGVDNTFLLQYDAVIDPRYISLFKNEADDRTELGLWYEIVRPLTNKLGLPWRGEPTSNWDWHIVPGFSMAYTQEERKLLADAAMDGFKAVYGYYPKTVASWLIDSFTMEYLSENYDISAFAVCRDQTNTDAYTLVGGYFNQGYYPSKKNMFTPAQTKSMQINVPVFRLLGPDPIHSYAPETYEADMPDCLENSIYTLEAVGGMTFSLPSSVDWYYRTYFVNEDMGFSYAQIGQENNFARNTLGKSINFLIEKGKEYDGVRFMKMCDTGEAFKNRYEQTPATAISALDNWVPGHEDKLQSVFYNCKNYTANIFRCENRIFIRGLYLFDETVEDYYLEQPCTTWDAMYENLPVVDTAVWQNNGGMLIDTEGVPFSVKKVAESELLVFWADKAVVFSENRIVVENAELSFDISGANAAIEVCGNKIGYSYKGKKYALKTETATVTKTGNVISVKSDKRKILLEFIRE